MTEACIDLERSRFDRKIVAMRTDVRSRIAPLLSSDHADVVAVAERILHCMDCNQRKLGGSCGACDYGLMPAQVRAR